MCNAKKGNKFYRFEKSESLSNIPNFITWNRCDPGFKSPLIAMDAKTPSLLSLLHRGRSSRSKEAKDKICATKKLSKISPQITFDYRVSDQQVYLETALAILSLVKISTYCPTLDFTQKEQHDYKVLLLRYLIGVYQTKAKFES
jgi:hypothetical protein